VPLCGYFVRAPFPVKKQPVLICMGGLDSIKDEMWFMQAHAALQRGISVLMITGDHPETARSIGERVGIVSERALSGADLETMTDAELVEAVASVKIFSRMLPEHKLRIVEALDVFFDGLLAQYDATAAWVNKIDSRERTLIARGLAGSQGP